MSGFKPLRVTESLSDLNIGLKEHTTRIHLDELVKGKKNGIMVGISDAGELIKPSELFVIWRKLKVSGETFI